MNESTYNILFLCIGNSARSIMAEALLNRLGNKRYKVFSAGSTPKCNIHPIALHALQRQNFKTDGLRSKRWDEFATPEAPPLDYVFTLCDKAGKEVWLVWPGQPMMALWGIPDPAAVEGNDAEKAAAFNETMRMLSDRAGLLTALPLDSLDRLSLQQQLDDIGRHSSETDSSR